MIKKALVYMIVIVFIFLNFTFSASSTYENNSILFVGGSGEGNFSSINDALDNSTDGDIIYVYNGSYNERIVLNKSVSLLGESKKNAVLCGKDNFNILNIISSNVTIQGFLFINSSNSVLISNDCKNIFICDNIFYNNSNGILSEENSRNITVESSFFINNSECIRFYNTSNSFISDNDFFENQEYGIVLRKKSTSNFVSKNRFSYIGTGIINVDSSNNMIIKNNISSCYYGIYGSSSEHLFIYENELYNNSKKSVFLVNSGFFNISNNSFVNNEYGIYVNSCYNYSDFKNNLFIDNIQDFRVTNKPPVIRIPSFEMTVFIISLFISFLVFYIFLKKYEKT